MGRYLRVRGGPRHGRIDVVGTFSGPGESRDIFYRSRPAGDMVWAAWDRLEDNGFDGDIVAERGRERSYGRHAVPSFRVAMPSFKC